MNDHYDVAIIGGGIIGVATAYFLSQRTQCRTILIEEESELASHQTGRNSGVIHSGVYYKPGSQKAEFCTAGRDLLYHFCKQHQIEFRRCGKIIVASDESDEQRLDELLQTGTANGLRNLQILDQKGIAKFEPNAGGIAALHVPQAGIVNFAEVTRKLAELATECGCKIQLNSKLLDFEIDAKQNLILATKAGIIQSSCLINCAGLHSDHIAKICNVDPGVQIIPFRGEYFTIPPSQSDLVNGLIYPVPDPKLPFLGIHLTKKLDGSVEIGPNALFSMGRHAYDGFRFNQLSDLAASLSNAGFWRLSFRNWQAGLREIYRSLNRSALLGDVRQLLPAIERKHIKKSHSGIRAQAVSRRGDLISDFLIKLGHNSIHVLNAPSPAATASLAIGKHIVEMACERFDLSAK